MLLNQVSSPLLHFWECGVTEGVIRVVFKRNATGWIPLGVFLADSLLGVTLHLDLLPFAQLHDQNV